MHVKCGWLLQITPAVSSPNVEQKFIFPRTKQQQEAACLKILEELTISDEAASRLEQQTKSQSNSDLWHNACAGRITASNFGRICKCSWFKSRDVTKVQLIIKDLVYPRKFNHLPVAIKWGIDCEPKAVTCYNELHAEITVEECGLFLHPLYRVLYCVYTETTKPCQASTV